MICPRCSSRAIMYCAVAVRSVHAAQFLKLAVRPAKSRFSINVEVVGQMPRELIDSWKRRKFVLKDNPIRNMQDMKCVWAWLSSVITIYSNELRIRASLRWTGRSNMHKFRQILFKSECQEVVSCHFQFGARHGASLVCLRHTRGYCNKPLHWKGLQVCAYSVSLGNFNLFPFQGESELLKNNLRKHQWLWFRTESSTSCWNNIRIVFKSPQLHSMVTSFWQFIVIMNLSTSIFVSMALGAWSDKNGRKPILIIPCFGGLWCQLVYMLNVYYPVSKMPWVTIIILLNYRAPELAGMCILWAWRPYG